MTAKKQNQNPKNSLGKATKDTEKQRDKQVIPPNLERFVVVPKAIVQAENTLVQFDKVIRVQKDYFYEYKDEIVCMNKEVVTTDYGNDAPKKVRKYLKFINFPEHINYRKEIDVYYNLYRPLPHKPLKGDFPNILKMLNHIFRSKHYEMIMTYMWVLYMQPQHPLPFIGLVSAEKGTGKTKFQEFIKAIYCGNAKVIDAADLADKFNDFFMDKLCVLIDEKIDGKEEKTYLQKLKKLITGGTQTRKAKYQSSIDIEFYGKFIMCSNDDQTMLALEKENSRFWIIDVPKIEVEDVDILKKVINEIPAFLYFLQYEYKPLEREGRLWFKPKEFQTERGKIMQENSRSEVAKEIMEQLTDYFVEHENINEIYFSTRHFLSIYPIYKVKANYFSRVMKKEFSKGTTIKNIGNPFINDLDFRRCRCYTFHRNEIIKNKTEPPPEDTSKFYDPEWIDGDFD